MSNPFQHGSSSGFPPDQPFQGFVPRRPSYASIVSGSNPTSAAQGDSSSSQQPPHRSTAFSHILNPASDYHSTPSSGLYSDSYPIAVAQQPRSYERDGESNGRGYHGSSLPSNLWRRDGNQGLLGKASKMMAQRLFNDDSGRENRQRNDGFWVPSYLIGSSYEVKLKEAYKQKQAEREASQQQQTQQALQPQGSATSLTSLNSNAKSSSHRGLSFDVIEKPPSLSDGDSVDALPSKWNKDDKYGGLEVLGDGREVKYTGPRSGHERDHEACAVRADHFMPLQCGLYYFEVQIMHRKRDETTIFIGFSSREAALSRPPGWEPESWGYHGDDGNSYACHNVGKHYGPPFGPGDVVGCGVNFRTGEGFFTRNGKHHGVAFRDVRGKLYPSVGLKRTGEHVKVNFGQEPFVFNIDTVMGEERAKIRKEISLANTSRLAPPLNEPDLIQQLVLQFLQQDGYVETARAFAEEISTEKQALSLDPNAALEGINIKDDQDANQRQRIRRAILEGDIDRALKFTNIFYPQVLKENEQVYFRLRCRKFIEMVRRAGELSSSGSTNGTSTVSNGHTGTAEGSAGKMDIDDANGYSDNMETEDGNAGVLPFQNLDAMTLLKETLEYGQVLQAEFSNHPRKDLQNQLTEIYSLLAYPNPLEQPSVSHLLDRKARVTMAEELNSAILRSLGKSSRSALENVYAQTTVLLDYLREDGGPGAFVTVQSVIDEIPKSQSF